MERGDDTWSMAMEDLPRRLAHDLAELAAMIRTQQWTCLMGRGFTGEDVEFFASDLVREGFVTPAALRLVAPPRFRPLEDALALLDELLDELQCPSLEDLAEWWPEECFEERYPTPARVVGHTEALWLALVDACPALASSYDPYETNFYTAGLIAKGFVRLLTDGDHDEELRTVLQILDDQADDERLAEVIGAGVLEYLERELAEHPPGRASEFRSILDPEVRRLWDQLTTSQ
jgi:hypothetical protein